MLKGNRPAISPSFVFAFQHAVKCLEAGDHAGYEASCKKAAAECPELWLGLASAEMGAGSHVEALTRLCEALEHAQNPRTRAMCLNNIGNILSRRGDLVAARRAFEEGLKLEPRSPELLANYALCSLWNNDVDQALKLINKAVERKPDFHQAYFTRSLIHLVKGDLVTGFREYEERFKNPSAKTRKLDVGKPEWDSFNPKGKRILLYSEQGVGDTLQFVRFVPRLKAAGATVHLCCQRGLRRLLMPTGWFEGIYEPGEAVPLARIDCVFPVMSLARAFRVTLDDVSGEPYLHAPLGVQQDAGLPFKVGIAWSGSKDHAHDHLRSIPWEQFETLLGLDGVHYYSLQVGPKSLDILDSLLLTDDTSELKDYADTANYISGLDLIISVDTSIVHLAGAIGKQCWALIPFSPDWRWLLEGRSTNWYQSVTLLRQEKPREWAPVLAQAREALQETVHGYSTLENARN